MRRLKMHFHYDEILCATEHYLIQEWKEGRRDRPTSPLNAAATLAIHALEFLNATQGRPFPSEKEFQQMLYYVRDRYTLSSAFPCSNQELKNEMAAKIQAIQERKRE